MEISACALIGDYLFYLVIPQSLYKRMQKEKEKENVGLGSFEVLMVILP